MNAKLNPIAAGIHAIYVVRRPRPGMNMLAYFFAGGPMFSLNR